MRSVDLEEENEMFERTMRILSSMLDPNMTYSVGEHMFLSVPDDLDTISNSILEKGLISKRHEGSGIPEMVAMKGSTDAMSKLEEITYDLIDRCIEDEYLCNCGGCIVCIPATVKDSNGEDIYLGVFPDDMDFIGKDDPRQTGFAINLISRSCNGVPREFILASINRTTENGISINPNFNYISNLPEEEQTRIMEEYFSKANVYKEQAIFEDGYINSLLQDRVLEAPIGEREDILTEHELKMQRYMSILDSISDEEVSLQDFGTVVEDKFPINETDDLMEVVEKDLAKEEKGEDYDK